MKLRVLQLGTKNFGIGGLSTIVFQLGKFQNGIIFDYFILSEKLDTHYRKEIEKRSGKVYLFKRYQFNFLNIFFGIKQIKKMDKHHIYHIHASVAYIALYYLICCKLLKVNKIVVHSHSAGIEGKYKIMKSFFHYLSKIIMGRIKKQVFACSEEAAKWMFSSQELKNVKIIKNGIELDKFFFDKDLRVQIRKELGMTENIVLGHVGRYVDVKNHNFILKVYMKLLEKNKKYRLVLIGTGSNINFLKKVLKDYNIEEKVKIIEQTKEVYKYLMAMDSFIFPSKFEGLGMAVIEAQVSGLTIFASNKIPKITKITENIMYLDLDKGEEYWSDIIQQKNLNSTRKNLKIFLENSDYNIKKSAKNLEKEYKKIFCYKFNKEIVKSQNE